MVAYLHLRPNLITNMYSETSRHVHDETAGFTTIHFDL